MIVKWIFFVILAKYRRWIFTLYLKAQIKDGYHKVKIGEGVIAGPKDFIQLCTAALNILEKKDQSLYDYLARSVGFLFYPRDDKIGFFTNISYGVWPIRFDQFQSEKQNVASALKGIVIYAYLRKSCIVVRGFPIQAFSTPQNEVHEAAKARAREFLKYD